MFLASLARPGARRIAARLPRAYSTQPPIDPEIRHLLEAERESNLDPAVRKELEAFLNAPTPPSAKQGDSEEPDDEDFDYGGPEPLHASILEPTDMAKTGRELFGLSGVQEAGLQTLPENFDLRQLPLPGPLPETYTEVQFAATVVHGRSIHRPFRHPQTHNLPAASIQFRSHEILPMHLFVHFATHAAYSLGIPCTRMYSLPTTRQLWTVPRSPFAHKKAQENFERKVHRRGIKAYDADPGVVDLWFRYLQRHAMGGVGMRCVKWERMPMGVGQKAQSEVMDALHRQKQWTTTKSKIKDLGVKIVQREMGVPTPRPDNIKTVVQK